MGIFFVFINLLGFGWFMVEYVIDFIFYGIYFVDRRFKLVEELIDEFMQVR